MPRRAFFVLATLLIGVALSSTIGSRMFGMAFDGANGGFFVLGAVLLGGFPAVLAALPSRVALILLGVIAALVGVWGASVLSMPGDGAIGGFLLLFVDVALVLYGLAIIGLGKLLLKKPTAENDF